MSKPKLSTDWRWVLTPITFSTKCAIRRTARASDPDVTAAVARVEAVAEIGRASVAKLGQMPQAVKRGGFQTALALC